LVDSEDITNTPPERRGIGFVCQDCAVFPHLDVAENIAFGLRLQSGLGGLKRVSPLRGTAVEQRVKAMCQLLSIGHLLHRRTTTLSGGEQQRVALARALVVAPRLLLLDEPLSALDPEMREGLQRELARVHRELGTTTLHVTHDFEEAVALGDRIGVVHDGLIVQVGTPEDIFRRPVDTFVARFVGMRNVFPGHIHAGQPCWDTAADDQESRCQVFKSRDLALIVMTDLTGEAHASVRPEDIIVSTQPLRSSARNRFQGRIVDIADRGTLIYLTVRVSLATAANEQGQTANGEPADFTCVITRRSREEMALQENKVVHIAFKAPAVHVF
jgi:ABC-type Fe3+/spermidine/putrescine transport system ATPase subunit